MKIIQLFSIVALLQGSTSSAAEAVEIINDASTQAWPPVEIINTTPFHAKGTMKFAACSNDNYRKVRVCYCFIMYAIHLIVFTSHHMN